MKLYLIILTILAFSSCLSSQTIQQVKADQQNYFWGEGTGTTLKRADNDALSMLINQISTQVESRFELLKEETGNEYRSTQKKIYIRKTNNAKCSIYNEQVG